MRVDYYIATSGADQIPLWDFKAVAPQNYKDSSAAAITASALLELAVHTSNATYHSEAIKIIRSLGGGD